MSCVSIHFLILFFHPLTHSFLTMTRFLLSFLPCLLTDSFFHSFIHSPVHDELISVSRHPSLLSPVSSEYYSCIYPSVHLFYFTSGWFSGSPPSAGSFPPNSTGEVLTDVGQISRASQKPNCCNHIYLALISMFDILSQQPDNRSVARAGPRAVKTRRSARAMLNTHHLGPP